VRPSGFPNSGVLTQTLKPQSFCDDNGRPEAVPFHNLKLGEEIASPPSLGVTLMMMGKGPS